MAKVPVLVGRSLLNVLEEWQGYVDHGKEHKIFPYLKTLIEEIKTGQVAVVSGPPNATSPKELFISAPEMVWSLPPADSPKDDSEEAEKPKDDPKADEKPKDSAEVEKPKESQKPKTPKKGQEGSVDEAFA